MFNIKSVFQYIFKAVQQSQPYSYIEKVLKPQLPVIEQQELLSLYHDVKDIYDKGEQIANLYSFNRVPTSLGTQSPWDWKYQHTMRAKLTGFDVTTGQYTEKYVTVGSDTPQTKDDWLTQLEGAGQSLFGKYDIEVQKVEDFQYFVRNR